MSAAVDNNIEQSAIENSNVGAWAFTKEVLANRAYHVFEAPQRILEIMGSCAGIANASLSPIYMSLGKLVSTENIVFFFTDLTALPEQVRNLSQKVTGWWSGSHSVALVQTQARKFIAHIGSTIGDYHDACDALSGLKVQVGKIHVVSDTVGRIGGIIGASSRIFDFYTEPSSVTTSNLTPQLESVKKPLAESKDFWNVAKDVSILALGILGLTCSTVPPVLVVGLSTSILGSRMVAYYREVQLKTIDAGHPQMKAAKQQVIKK